MACLLDRSQLSSIPEGEQSLSRFLENYFLLSGIVLRLKLVLLGLCLYSKGRVMVWCQFQSIIVGGQDRMKRTLDRFISGALWLCDVEGVR